MALNPQSRPKTHSDCVARQTLFEQIKYPIYIHILNHLPCNYKPSNQIYLCAWIHEVLSLKYINYKKWCSHRNFLWGSQRKSRQSVFSWNTITQLYMYQHHEPDLSTVGLHFSLFWDSHPLRIIKNEAKKSGAIHSEDLPQSHLLRQINKRKDNDFSIPTKSMAKVRFKINLKTGLAKKLIDCT